MMLQLLLFALDTLYIHGALYSLAGWACIGVVAYFMYKYKGYV